MRKTAFNAAAASRRLLSLITLVLALTHATGATSATPPEGYTPPIPPAGVDNDQSAWFDAQKQRAADRLGGSQFDVLVVPFQVVNDGLDQAARTLMTLSLSDGVRRSTGLTVATPSLVAQAMGLNRRTFSDDEIEELAASLGVRHVLVGAVGQASPGTFRYQVRIADVGSDGKLADRRIFVSDELPLDDVRIPYEQFLDTREKLIRAAFTDAKPLTTEPVTREQEALPATVADVLDAEGLTAIGLSHRLQFLAMLMPDDAYSLLQQQLYARSLVVLERADPRSSDYAVLRARAFLHLHRRPAAMPLLDDARSPAARALRAYANGNSIELGPLAENIEPGLLAFAGKLDSDRLHLQYVGTPDTGFSEAVLEQNPVWGALMYAALNDRNRWRQYSVAPVKLTLEQTHPEPELTIETFVTGKLTIGELFGEQDFVRLSLRHLDRIDKTASVPGSESDPLALALTDYTELMRELLPAEIAAEARHVSMGLGNPEDALELLDTYDEMFSGYPAIAHERIVAIGRIHQANRSGPEAARLEARLKEAGRRAIRVPGGVHPGNAWLQHNRNWYFDDNRGLSPDNVNRRTYSSDWPAAEVDNYPSYRSLPDKVQSLEHCLAYTLTNIECLVNLSAALVEFGRAGDVEQARQMLDANAGRFLGHPAYIESMSRALKAVGDKDGADQLRHLAIESGTLDWSAYDKLGRELIRETRYEEALDVALRYPGFNGVSTSGAVGISNEAYAFGSQLYWAGAYEQARPLYVIATTRPTGSEADMSSAQRLALLDGDYEQALEHASRRVRRYESPYGLRDAMQLLVLQGATAQALSVVDGFQPMLKAPPAWDGALTAQRADNRSAREITKWAFDGDRLSMAGEGSLLPLRFAFLAYTLDRTVDASLAEMLHIRDRRVPLTLHDGRNLKRTGRPHRWPTVSPRRDPLRYKAETVSQEDIDRMPDSPRKFLLQPGVPSTINLDELTDYAARALAALDAGDDAKAYAEFHEASEFYELEEFLPYYALVAARTGQTQRIEDYLEASGAAKQKLDDTGASVHGQWFHDYVASAAVEGTAGDHESALDHLARANAAVLHNNAQFVYTRYQLLEIARRLYEGTRDERYRAFARDLARRYATIEPTEAYTHSFVAMLSTDRRERVTALARVLVLDPQSRCIGLADAAELAEARELAKEGFPPLKAAVADT